MYLRRSLRHKIEQGPLSRRIRSRSAGVERRSRSAGAETQETQSRNAGNEEQKLRSAEASLCNAETHCVVFLFARSMFTIGYRIIRTDAGLYPFEAMMMMMCLMRGTDEWRAAALMRCDEVVFT